MTARTQGAARRPRRARRSRSSRRLSLSTVSLARLRSFFTLVTLWLKHWLVDLVRRVNPARSSRRRNSRQRERIYVDASYHAGEAGEKGIGGIGVWVPRLGIAIAIKVDAKSSMEAEILALLAGTLAAKRLRVERPLIFSDCKSAVRTATHHMALGKTPGIFRKLGRLAELSIEHRAFCHVFDSLHALRGTIEWQPRENNREADLASSIGSRHGHMGIMLSGAKDRNHALNDVLSAATNDNDDMSLRKYRCGTRTVRLTQGKRHTASSRRFAREAKKLIAQLSSLEIAA